MPDPLVRATQDLIRSAGDSRVALDHAARGLARLRYAVLCVQARYTQEPGAGDTRDQAWWEAETTRALSEACQEFDSVVSCSC